VRRLRDGDGLRSGWIDRAVDIEREKRREREGDRRVYGSVRRDPIGTVAVVAVERVLEGGIPRQIPDIVRFEKIIPDHLEVPIPGRGETRLRYGLVDDGRSDRGREKVGAHF